jgi:uncharacterized protein (TIGR02597 family)
MHQDPTDPTDAFGITHIWSDASRYDINLMYSGLQSDYLLNNMENTYDVEYKDHPTNAWAMLTTSAPWTTITDASAAGSLMQRYYRVKLTGVAAPHIIPTPTGDIASEPVGFNWLSLQPGGNYISIPLHNIPTYRGGVMTLESNILTVCGAPGWNAGQFKAQDGWSQYYVIARSGACQGEWWMVMGNTADTLLLNNRGTDLTTLLSAGDCIELRHVNTMEQVLGSDANGTVPPETPEHWSSRSFYPLILAKDDGSGNVGDMVYYAKGLGFEAVSFYFDDGFDTEFGWYYNQRGPFGGATMGIYPDQALMVKIAGSHPKSALIMGNVQKSKFVHYLDEGTLSYNAVCNPFPVSAKISASGLHDTAGWRDDTTGNGTVDTADIVRNSIGYGFPDTVKYINLTTPITGVDAGWYVNLALNNDYPFVPGSVWFVYKQTPAKWIQNVPANNP